MRLILILILGAYLPYYAGGQTCCSGGVPVSSNLGLSHEDAGTLQLSLTADFNILKSLFAASIRLSDDLRTRTTQSYIVRGAYTFSSKWQIEGFIPVVRQTRSIIGNNGDEDFQSTFGIGDPVLLVTYAFLNNEHQLRLGLGPQIPLGRYNHRNAQGLFLVEDLQPGSGAWDLILFANYRTSLKSRPSSAIYLNTIYNASGVNTDSRGGQQSYQFGDEIQLIAGVSDQFLLFNQIIQPGIALRYRSVARDKIDGIDNSGTGGRFTFIRLSNAIQFSKNSIAFLLELPISRFVNETQLAPTFSFNISWVTQFSIRKNQETIIQF